MKLLFEKDLEYQSEAIKSICGIFEGQEIFQSNFSVNIPYKTDDAIIFGPQSGYSKTTIGIGNKLKVIDENILSNVQKIQLRNGLPQSTEESFRKEGMNFTVEMETGTGKTYVYLRTIFELNQKYGFTKFIIVVPSIAIKEGTNKSLQITEEHFKGIYGNTVYNYFVYDSNKLEQVRSFATSDNIEIMVINIDAFRKSFENDDENNKSNVIHRYKDTLGFKPIELIQETNPIVIIDEPQSVDNTDKAKEAISALNPLCCLRYSATHKQKYNLMYKLDSVDAYEMKLVKQIEVATAEVEGYMNSAYIFLEKVDNRSGIKAYLELDVQTKGKVARSKKWVKQGDDLYDITKRDQYEGYIVKDIVFNRQTGLWEVSFTSNSHISIEGKALGSVSQDLMEREQIRITIESHLDKELLLNPLGIKVLSLFFLDKVANYRQYDDEGNKVKGKYALMFEEEYEKLITQTKYQSLFKEIKDKNIPVDNIHDGYFSIDKRGKVSNKKEKFECFVDSSGKTAKDDDAFNLIMKDKERLLSFDEPLRFIFSHSALKEGWDNPNVFQICTLIDSKDDLTKRQKVGRGLRLCVNQNGERVRGFEVNTLTVMANESYEDFAKGLQKEIEEDTGYKFGLLQRHSFAHIVVDDTSEKPVYLNEEKSRFLYDFFEQCGYIKEEVVNNKTKEVAGKVQDKLRLDLKDNRVSIPDEFNFIKGHIIKTLRKVSGNINIKNRNDARKISLRKEVLLSPEFSELWNRIKFKTTYSVNFNSDALVSRCAQRIFEEVSVGKGKFITKKIKLETTAGAVTVNEATLQRTAKIIEETVSQLPDIVTYLQNETNLTRISIVDILVKSKRLDAFKKNPQAFIESVLDIIKAEMRLCLVDGIKYRKLGGHDVWCQELFENVELQGYLNSNLMESKKSPYDYVIYDSPTVELPMATAFEQSQNVKVYAKLPSWFRIDTPLGPYNPDWALVWEENGKQRLYFVVETKGGMFEDSIKATELAKIKCGKEHFKAVSTGVEFALADRFKTLEDTIMNESAF